MGVALRRRWVRRWAALVLACALLHVGNAARAEETWSAEQLRELRLEGRDVRKNAGVVLLVWGLANTLGGALMIGFGHDHEAWLGAGVTTATFGAINAALAFPLLDLSGARRQQILDDPQTDLLQLREAERVAELKSGQFYAVNFGFDVAYITAGVLLFVIGNQTDGPRWAQGAGVSAAAQGTFLLGFDLFSWIGCNSRAARF
jgi:hypothetical protein